MKRWNFGWIVIGILFMACNAHKAESPNGWYVMTERDQLASEPIVTVDDFVKLRLDSVVRQDGQVMYQISGLIAKEKIQTWAEATEKAIGGYIGFVFDNKIVMKPMVNMRIESGNFMITLPPGSQLDIHQIYQKLTEQMNK